VPSAQTASLARSKSRHNSSAVLECLAVPLSPCFDLSRLRNASNELDQRDLYEPLTVAPFVFLEQDATQLGQRVRPRIIERRRTRSRSATVSATTAVCCARAFSRRERVGSSTSLTSSRTSSSGIRRPARYTKRSLPRDGASPNGG
jgi:hypothetical protein